MLNDEYSNANTTGPEENFDHVMVLMESHINSEQGAGVIFCLTDSGNKIWRVI